MNFVNDDKLSLLRAEKSIRVVEPPLIGATLEVEIDGRWPPLIGNDAGQRSFAYLARAQEHNAGHGPQASVNS